MKGLRLVLAAAGALTVLAATAPAHADWDHNGWRRQEWREHERRERAWREHEWRRHHMYRPGYVHGPPPPPYRTPGAYYPRHQVYAPPGGPGIGFTFR
jgi:hypothetical protein